MVETAAYRRMLVQIQLERLSFVGEMIYLTVELNFHKTTILFRAKVAVGWVEKYKELYEVNRSNTRNIHQVYSKGRPGNCLEPIWVDRKSILTMG